MRLVKILLARNRTMNQKKITKFRDIPLFTNWGGYSVHVPLHHFERSFAHYLENGLEVTPEFQRGHVWTYKQREAYLEFFMKGGKSGREILFNCPSWQSGGRSNFVLVDGLQRLTTIRLFLSDRLLVFGSKYSEFIDNPDTCVHSLIFVVNNLKTDIEVLQWYIELNSGGTPHTEDEINKVKEMITKLKRGKKNV